MRFSFMTATLFAVALSACGGGNSGSGNSNNQPTATTASNTEIITNLKSSNIDFFSILTWLQKPPGTWRWLSTPSQHVLVYIPAPTNGNTTEQDYANKVNNAIVQINTKLRNVLVLEPVSVKPANVSFIQISYGTSYVPPGTTNYQDYCANVSEGPSIGNMILPNSEYGIKSNPVFVNLGNGHCDVTQDIVTHEFGHALGLANHFKGFGIGDAISPAFWDVLATLYGNPQSTTAQNLIVRRTTN
ncbi:hypothetical protein [Undibacterium baiyunense]|nr:hypothetical protein [Undibacterium baiyunense]